MVYKYIIGSLVQWVECSPIIQETCVQSQAASYQRLLKSYLMPPCLTLSNIRYVSRVKWSNPEKGAAPSPTPRCSSYWKGSLLVTLDYGRQLYFTNKYVHWYHLKRNILHPTIIAHRIHIQAICGEGLVMNDIRFTKQLLYGHLPPITKTIKIRQTKHTGHS